MARCTALSAIGYMEGACTMSQIMEAKRMCHRNASMSQRPRSPTLHAAPRLSCWKRARAASQLSSRESIDEALRLSVGRETWQAHVAVRNWTSFAKLNVHHIVGFAAVGEE